MIAEQKQSKSKRKNLLFLLCSLIVHMTKGFLALLEYALSSRFMDFLNGIPDLLQGVPVARERGDHAALLLSVLG